MSGILKELTKESFKMTHVESPGNAFEYVQDPQSHQTHLSGTDLEDIPTCLDSPKCAFCYTTKN